MNKLKFWRLLAGTAVFAAALITELAAEKELWYLFLAAYLILGAEVIWHAAKHLVKGKLFDEYFLMTVATVGAFIIGEFPEAAAVMLFFEIGELASGIAYDRSVRSITALMDMRPEYANLLKDGTIEKVSPESVSVGDFIVIKAGEKIPLDGIVTEGAATLDTSAMTGEFLPKEAAAGDEVLSGCINKNGLITLRVTKPFGESALSKVLSLVENAAEKKAPAEKFITRFSRVYTPSVVVAAVLIAVLPPLLFEGVWAEWIHRGLIFLVVSCPCALVLSVPLGYFAGLGRSSREGVLVKGGEYLDALARTEIAVFDKTGTLTQGQFGISGIFPAEGETEETLLSYAAHAEYYSLHPIAAAVRGAYKGEIFEDEITNYTETAGHGVSVLYKGAEVLAGNGKLLNSRGINFECGAKGTKILVAAAGKYIGCLVASDTIKPDSAESIKQLRAEGIKKTVMLTGDSAEAAKEIADRTGIDEVHAGLLPHEKTELVEKLKREGRLVFTGDGINDAPALKCADIGIAMGGLGSDAAIEAADAVLMTDNIGGIVKALKTSRRVRAIITQNIVFILTVKFAVLALGAFGLAGMWAAVFADIGTSLLAVLNSMRILRRTKK